MVFYMQRLAGVALSVFLVCLASCAVGMAALSYSEGPIPPRITEDTIKIYLGTRR